MLWAKARTSRAYRTLATAVSLMLALMIVSPGVAVFADESSEVPEVVVPIEVSAEVPAGVPAGVPAQEPEIVEPEVPVLDTTKAFVDEPVVLADMKESEEVLPMTVPPSYQSRFRRDLAMTSRPLSWSVRDASSRR